MTHHRITAASREIPRAIERRVSAALADSLAMQLAALFATEQSDVLREIGLLYERQHREYLRQRSAIVAERRIANAQSWDGLFSIVDKALADAEALLKTDELKKAYRAVLGIGDDYPNYFENLASEVRQAILRDRHVPGLSI